MRHKYFLTHFNTGFRHKIKPVTVKQECVHTAPLWALRETHVVAEGLAQGEVGKGQPSSVSTRVASATHPFPVEQE